MATEGRRFQAAVLIGLPLLTVLLIPHRDDLSLSTILVLYLALVVVIATVGGLAVGLVAAVAAFLLENWFFTPPLHTLTVADAEHLVALTAFVAVSALVSLLVGRAVRRTREAVRARAEAEALARTTASLIGGADPLPRWSTSCASGSASMGWPCSKRRRPLDDAGRQRPGRWRRGRRRLAGAPTGSAHPHQPQRA